jgi:predicted nucleic acid-binding Zn ribbon protein
VSPISPLPQAGGPGPRQAAESLDRLLASLGGPRASVLTTVFASWTELVGDTVAAHAQPRSLRRGVLVVTVDEPAWATQLRWLEADLLARMAEALGEAAVTAIEIRVHR